jgi:tetratricopeptide (TPR) repeat protein
MRLFRSLTAFAGASAIALGILATVASANTGETTARNAFKALQAGQYQQSVELYAAAIESRALEPEVLANALLNKALALQYLQKHKDAIAEYTTALELDAMAPQLRATVLYNRGLSYQKLGDMPPAIEDFTSALTLYPTMAHAFLSRGNALRDSGQLLFALSDYERALQYQHPDAARVHFASALTYESLRRPKDAMRSLGLALQINPDHEGARKKLAEISLKLPKQADSDPISTGSIAAMGATTLQKPKQAAPVEPKPVLLDQPSEAAGQDQVLSNLTLEPSAPDPKIPDRLPSPETADTTEQAEIAGPETEPLAEEVAAITGSTAPVLQEGAPPAAVDQQGLTGWAVQFASASSEEGAWSTWANIQGKHKILRDVTPTVVRADLGAKGIFYRVRLTGFENQAEAKASCKKLKRGGADCYVSKAGS